MAKPGKVNLPSGMGGLTRYFDDYTSNIELKPGHIIIMAAVIVVLVILLHLQGNALLGLG
ncbi:preprotein translocase subunit Sec61beta [Candidatus Woesearchaeota archaeon]|jgi:preprotein translocase subunit Sec61beta|nr:preprotein translocase subunit Sec61beta [Candidatus Woesearchaeota archaeon]